MDEYNEKKYRWQRLCPKEPQGEFFWRVLYFKETMKFLCLINYSRKQKAERKILGSFYRAPETVIGKSLDIILRIKTGKEKNASPTVLQQEREASQDDPAADGGSEAVAPKATQPHCGYSLDRFCIWVQHLGNVQRRAVHMRWGLF